MAPVDFPAALAEVAEVDFPYDADTDIDYEPYREFLSDEDTASWLRAWTGAEDPGVEFRVFGQDGTGGYVAFWMARRGLPVEKQPVVFLGSEGEHGVVARDLNAYLWLLAGGSGPMEAVLYGPHDSVPRPELVAIAERHAPDHRQPPGAVLEEAVEGYPDFPDLIESLCR